MPSDYDWSLPSINDSGGGYDFSGNDSWTSNVDSADVFGSDSPSTFSFDDLDWYVDSTSNGGDTSILDDVWAWVKSPQGTSVLGGAVNTVGKLWAASQANEMKKDEGPSAAELYDARVKAHNASINKPMDMGLLRYAK